jgi:hypothetical protein
MSDDDYRFHPEDFEDGGDPTDARTDPAPLVIVASFGVGLGLYLASPFLDPLAVGGSEIELTTVAAAVFALGLAGGGGSYVRRGRYRIGGVHLVGAFGWLLLLLGATVSSPAAAVVGGAALLAAAGALLVLLRRSNV